MEMQGVGADVKPMVQEGGPREGPRLSWPQRWAADKDGNSRSSEPRGTTCSLERVNLEQLK